MDSSRPLSGLRVLDTSRLLPGPYATMILADLGASVDKLEDTGPGDFLRITQPLVDDGMGALFHIVNRGKRSLAIDLKSDEGKKAFLELVAKYDVLLESNRPGVMDRLGLGYDVLSQVNPGLVVCAITGYGQTGPMKDRAGHDLNYIARAGVLGSTGPADGPPQMPGVQVADVTGGLYAVIGILAAIEGRRKTGKGRFVDISMAEAALSVAVVPYGTLEGGFDIPRGADSLAGGIAPYNTYTTKDGGSMTLGALEPKFWKNFCEAVGIPFDMKGVFPGAHQAGLKAQLREIFAGKTLEEWKAIAVATDCCLEPVLSAKECREDPMHLERGVFTEGRTQGGKPVSLVRTPVAMPAEGAAPRQGQDTDQILRDAGLDDARIAALRAAGVIKG